MLLRFSVENFLSFDKREQLSMAPGKFQRHKTHTIRFGKRSALKAAFIYGANASGKSNLIKAVDFARDIIIEGIKNVDLNKKYFRIKHENYFRPGVFQFEIVLNGTLYSYGFAISYDKKQVIDEWLYEINENHEKCIFNRETIDGVTNVTSDLQLKGEKATIFKVYKEDIKRMNDSLFLSEMAEKQIKDINEFLIFNEVYKWFLKLIIVFPNSKYGNLNKIISDEEMKSEFGKYLRYFDTGIDNIFEQEIEFDKAFSGLDDDLAIQLKSKLSNDLNEKNVIGLRGSNLLLSFYKNNDGEITVKKMVMDHGNVSDLFDYVDESDGTRRLFDLIPLFFSKYTNNVILIDEIDRSLHTKLTAEFIDLFYKLSEDNESQLIVTTHDAFLMDLDKIRQDEIWFIERGSDHSSSIYSLDEFKVRYDKKIEKDYLIGRYGAIPVFNSFSNVDEMEVNENEQV